LTLKINYNKYHLLKQTSIRKPNCHSCFLYDFAGDHDDEADDVQPPEIDFDELLHHNGAQYNCAVTNEHGDFSTYVFMSVCILTLAS